MSELFEKTPVLSVNNLSVAFGNNAGNMLQVTDGVSFDIYPGEFFALVGESGCGKSVTAMSILRLLPYPSAKIVNGDVLFNINSSADCSKKTNIFCDLVKLSLTDLQKIRGSEIACIFQEPMQALNPVLTIKKQLLEVFKFNASCKKNNDIKSSDNAIDVISNQLKLAGFTDPERILNSYPHELSGGMLQRICIVMALLFCPKLIIADEPTTALDVTVQAQVLDVLKEMTQKTGTAVLLITHNMGIVSQYAKRVAVMYAGRIVESGPVNEVISSPMHPYTQGLLAAIPENHKDMKNLQSIPGFVPHPKDFAKGCRFANRCEKCANANADIQKKCKSDELPPQICFDSVRELDSQKKDVHIAYCFLK